ncbi:ABC transporter ATP-binding protein [Cohaesibacter celericrescens]|uniref:ABC transporter ATP-binding protein n=1 Tax=Cohaesibacter celericrescens TaxID=2067669 RepID=UPI00356145DB
MYNKKEVAVDATSPTCSTTPNDAALFSMRGISKSFGDFPALEDIDIAFFAGEVHCLLGENGAGKSTLCNLIFGVHAPSTGEMQLDNAPYAPDGPRIALAHNIAMVHQHFSLINELSVIDNLLLGQQFGKIDRKAEAVKITALAAEFGLELAPFEIVGDLSVGQRQRVEIVKCLMQRPRLLILDEPTAVLLPSEIDSLLGVCRTVADNGCAVVMVTHKLAEIKQIADRVTVLREGKIVRRSDAPAEQIPDLVRAMIQKSPLMAGAETSLGVQNLPPRTPRSLQGGSREVMQLDGLSLVDPIGVRRLNALTLTVESGEIVGIAGVEGNGQSELGAILSGMETATEGRWFVGQTELTHANARKITAAGVGIVPEDRHLVGAIGQMSVADNLFLNRMHQFARFGLIDRVRQQQTASDFIDQYDVRTQGPHASFASLSGGNQQKAVLARELTTPNLKFLLAAQPTRGLDVGAIEAVYRRIRAAADTGVGVLLISSELDELIAVADRIIVFYRGQIVGTHSATPKNRDAIGALMSGQLP